MLFSIHSWYILCHTDRLGRRGVTHESSTLCDNDSQVRIYTGGLFLAALTNAS